MVAVSPFVMTRRGKRPKSSIIMPSAPQQHPSMGNIKPLMAECKTGGSCTCPGGKKPGDKPFTHLSPISNLIKQSVALLRRPDSRILLHPPKLPLHPLCLSLSPAINAF